MTDVERKSNSDQSEILSEIKNLGVLCYNKTDGAEELPSELKKSIDDLRKAMNGAEPNGMSASDVENAVTELGLLCYNLYVDKKLSSDDLRSVCIRIDNLNHGVGPAEPQNNDGYAVGGAPLFGNANGLADPFYDQFSSVGVINEEFSEPDMDRNGFRSEFKENWPYGMEPIPEAFIKCKCGYRNRPYANFCGKCGVTLKRRSKANVH